MSGNIIFIFSLGSQLWHKVKVKVNYYTVICDNFCQWLAIDWWVFQVICFPTNKADRHDITKILSKVALDTIKYKQFNVFSYIIWHCDLLTLNVLPFPDRNFISHVFMFGSPLQIPHTNDVRFVFTLSWLYHRSLSYWWHLCMLAYNSV